MGRDLLAKEARTLVIQRWRRADRNVRGIVADPSGLGDTSIGLVIFICLPLVFLDQAVLQMPSEIFRPTWPAWPAGWAGWILLCLLGLAMASNLLYYRPRGINSWLPADSARQALGKIALTLPIFHWLYEGWLKKRAGALFKHSFRNKDLFDAIALSSPFYLWVVLLDVLLPLWFSIWLVAPDPLPWERWWIALILGFSFHGGLVMLLMAYLEELIPRLDVRWASCGGWRWIAQSGWFPVVVPFLVTGIFSLLESGNYRAERLTVALYQGRQNKSRYLGASSPSSFLAPRVTTTERRHLVGSFLRLQSLRLFGEGVTVGWIAPPMWPAVSSLLGLMIAGGVSGMSAAGLWIGGGLVPRFGERQWVLRIVYCFRWLFVLSIFSFGYLAGVVLIRLPLAYAGRGLFLSLSLGLLFLPLALGAVMALLPRSNCASEFLLWLFPVGAASLLSEVGSLVVSVNEGLARQTEDFWLVGSMVLVLGGPVVAAAHLPWLLKPSQWREIFDRTKSLRCRWRIGGLCLLALSPLSGLAIPFWMAREDRRIVASRRS